MSSRALEVVPEDQARHDIRGILLGVALEEPSEYDAEDDRHRDGVQQRPAQPQHRATVARSQVHLDQRQPEIPTPPDGAQVTDHAFSTPFQWAGILRPGTLAKTGRTLQRTPFRIKRCESGKVHSGGAPVRGGRPALVTASARRNTCRPRPACACLRLTTVWRTRSKPPRSERHVCNPSMASARASAGGWGTLKRPIRKTKAPSPTPMPFRETGTVRRGSQPAGHQAKCQEVHPDSQVRPDHGVHGDAQQGAGQRDADQQRQPHGGKGPGTRSAMSASFLVSPEHQRGGTPQPPARRRFGRQPNCAASHGSGQDGGVEK